MRSSLLLLALLLPATVLAQARPGASRGLEGAWRIAEVTTTGPNARTIQKPQPGLYLFTARHYSITREDSARGPDTAPRPEQTADQLRAVLRFSAQAGTYTVTGNQVRLERIAALAGPNMLPGNFALNTFRLQGDTLWITNTANQTGTVANPATYKLVRVE
jgi:hypothetical protein